MIDRVAVIGRDASFWLTLLALDGAFKRSGIILNAVELPSALRPGEAIAAAPSLSALHRRLDLEERALLRAASGIRAGGQHFRGWSADPFLMGYEDPVRLGESIDIGQFWAVERLAGASVSRDRLSPSAVAMANGRVAGDQAAGPFAIASGIHLDAAAYCAELKAECLRRGMAVRDGATCNAIVEGDRVARVDLGDGAPLAADLFIDASGADAVLIGSLGGDDWTSWGKQIPPVALAWQSAPPLMPRPPFVELARTDTGWRARIPLADRTAILSASSAAAGGNVVVAGQRTAWQGNVVAIGDAACRIEPGDPIGLHMTHAAIANLMAWFPAGPDMTAERDRFNQSVGEAGRHLLDFQACRHDAQRARERSASLDQRLALFDAVGWVPDFDDDPIEPSQWERYFAGLGRVPTSANVVALCYPPAQRHDLLGRIVANVDRQVADLPTVLQDIGR